MVVEVIQLAKVLKACDSCLVGAPGGTQLLQCLKLCCQMPVCSTGVVIGVGASAASGAGAARRNAAMEKRER